VNSPCVFLFPGQGSQHPGMGADLYDASEVVRDCIDNCGRAAGVDLPGAMFGAGGALDDPWIAQLAIFSLSVAIAGHLEASGVRPVAVAGHSLGEYAALVVAGCLGLDEAILLVSLRGQATARASRRRPGTMAAILGLSALEVERICKAARPGGTVVAANYNAPTQTAVSGDEVSVRLVGRRAEEVGGVVIPLGVAGAFHSALMAEAEAELAPALDSAVLEAPTSMVVSSVTGREVACLEEYRPLLARQMTRPVRWTDAVATLLALQPCTFLETGPGSALRGLLRSQAPGVVTWSLGTWRGVSSFLDSLRPEAPLKGAYP
jgi:[acyl-carrier-protein] S-malonyltransferase